MTRYAMAIDTKRCVGCQTCSVACKMANNLPKGIRRNHIITTGSTYTDCGGGTFPEIDMKFIPLACQHCAKPACVDICPTGASFQTEDGVVQINTEECIGCKACVAACPYDVRHLIEGEPEFYLDFATGDGMEPTHLAGTIDKCNLCYQRITDGGIPACMELCPGRARFWGDLDDPESEISKAIEGRETMKWLESEGTEPSTLYLV